MDAFARLVEAGAWWDAIRRLTGESFYPGLALGIVAVFLVALWRLPRLGGIDLSRFTGKVVLGIAVVLVLILVAVVVAEVLRREGVNRPAPAAPRPAEPKPAEPWAPPPG